MSIRRSCLFIVVLAGCAVGPSAPELRDSPVYTNDSEGFRFLVPDGWTQTASAILPEGDLDGETFLVRYRVKSPEMGSTLQVLCFQDKDEKTDLQKHHAGPSFRVEQWTPDGDRSEIDINGTSAIRVQYLAEVDGRSLAKNVVCFRRGDRVFSFVGLFWQSDEKAEQQIQRAVQSVIWEDS